MLVHMSPGEVEGLHKLALVTGGSLTLNPHTGLPEASWLSNLLPSIASAALNTMFPGLGSIATSAIVAAGSGLIQGSFEKGLKSGLQAYGTAQTMTGLKASAEADRAAKISKLEELKKTVGVDQISKPGPMDIFSSEYQRPTAPIATVRTPDIQAQIDKLTKEVAVPPKTGLAGLWQGVKGLSSTAGGEAFMRSLEGGYENPYLRSASQKAAIAGILAPFAKEPDQSKSSPMEYYIPGAKNPLYGTGRDQPYYLPGYYTKTPPKFADGGVIPAPNKLYPMGNIRQPGYAVPFQYPQASETLGGYDTAVDPFTGEESKPQVNFADGGQVDDFLTKLNQQVTTPTPFAVKPPTAGPEGLHIYQAPYKEGWVPPSGIKEYYQALLSPPAGGRDTSALRDYLDNLNKQFTKPTGPTGPTGPKTCPVGQHLNLQTMQCEDDIVPPPPPPPQDCPTGTYRDPSGQCLPIQPPPTECPSGKVRNPATGKCDDPAGPCPKGSHMEINDGVMTCEPDTPPVQPCPSGQHKDSAGNCVPDTPTGPTCPEGQVMDETGTCVKKKKVDIETCPDGYEMNAQGKCVKVGPTQPAVCPDGSHLDTNTMSCVPDTPTGPTCPEGQVMDETGTCVKKKKVDIETCPDGYEMNDQGKCVKTGPERPSVCPEGTVFDPQRVECVNITPPTQPTCPEGQVMDETGTCVKKKKVSVEECGAGQVMTQAGQCVDEGSFEGYMERYGRYLPLPVQVLYDLWQKSKKPKVTAEEFNCRGGADPVRDTRTNKMVCPEDLPSTGGDSKEPGGDLYRGSGGFDYGCPDPSMTILLANGGTVTAGDLKVGDVVRTKHEKTSEWGNFEVTHKEIVDQPKAEVILDGGDKKVIVSTSHKFWVDNEKNWVYTTELTHGDVLSGHILTDVKHLGTGPVVKITVKDAHTYVMEGLWSHNIKVVFPSGPKGSVTVDQPVDEYGNPIITGASGGQVPSGLRSLARGGITQYAEGGQATSDKDQTGLSEYIDAFNYALQSRPMFSSPAPQGIASVAPAAQAMQTTAPATFTNPQSGRQEVAVDTTKPGYVGQSAQGGRYNWEPAWNQGQGAWIGTPQTEAEWLEWDKQTGGGQFEGGRGLDWANPFRSNPNGTMRPVGSEYIKGAYGNWIDDPKKQQSTWFDALPNISPEMKAQIIAMAKSGQRQSDMPFVITPTGYAGGGMTQYAAAGKLLRGPGDGMSDDIYANIGGRQEARLADGEFVVPADVVSHIGNGSTNAGAKKLYKMMADIRRARTGRTKQAPAIRPDRYMPRS